jgi:hypothetical protein
MSNRYVQLGTIPTVEDVIAYFREQFHERDIVGFDPEREARRVYDTCVNRKWLDSFGGKVKFWKSYVERDIRNLIERAKVGNTVRKQTLAIVDCCWRISSECDCLSVIMPPGAADAPPLSLSAAMAAEPDPDQIAVAAFLAANVRHYPLPLADYADRNFVNSAVRDIARNVYNPDERGVYSDRATDYFTRMGVWLDFLSFLPAKPNLLLDEATMAWARWLIFMGNRRPASVGLPPGAPPITLLRASASASASASANVATAPAVDAAAAPQTPCNGVLTGVATAPAVDAAAAPQSPLSVGTSLHDVSEQTPSPIVFQP